MITSERKFTQWQIRRGCGLDQGVRGLRLYREDISGRLPGLGRIKPQQRAVLCGRQAGLHPNWRRYL